MSESPTLPVVPANYYKATDRNSPDSLLWNAAISRELDSIRLNETWDIVLRTDVPPLKTILGSTWVFTIKPKLKDLLYKARLCVQGFNQKPGIDYNIIYAPVLSYSTLRLMLGKCAQRRMFFESMDVSTAFLHGILLEDIYMKIPAGLPGTKLF